MDNKTVYVVGAGVSYEANLPTGKDLKDEIARLLKMKFDFHKNKYPAITIFSKHLDSSLKKTLR